MEVGTGRMSKEDYFKPADVEGHKEFDHIWGDPTYKPEIPRTMIAISKHLGKHEQTCYSWKKAFKGSGDFNIRDAFLKDQEKIWDAFMKAVGDKKINAQLFRTFAQLANELVEKREDKLTVEYTPDQIADNAERFIGYLKESLEANGGTCPVCLKPHLLLDEVCNN